MVLDCVQSFVKVSVGLVYVTFILCLQVAFHFDIFPYV